MPCGPRAPVTPHAGLRRTATFKLLLKIVHAGALGDQDHGVAPEHVEHAQKIGVNKPHQTIRLRLEQNQRLLVSLEFRLQNAQGHLTAEALLLGVEPKPEGIRADLSPYPIAGHVKGERKSARRATDAGRQSH